MTILDDLLKFASAYDQFGDGMTIVPQSLLTEAAGEIARLTGERDTLRLDLDLADALATRRVTHFHRVHLKS